MKNNENKHSQENKDSKENLDEIENKDDSKENKENLDEMENKHDSNTHSSEDRKMFKIKCSGCGADAEVPFKPTEGRDVFCRDCYRKRNSSRRF